jgi:hypothetical protein
MQTGRLKVIFDPGAMTLDSDGGSRDCGIVVTTCLVGVINVSLPTPESLSENAVIVVLTPPLDASPVVIGYATVLMN